MRKYAFPLLLCFSLLTACGGKDGGSGEHGKKPSGNACVRRHVVRKSVASIEQVVVASAMAYIDCDASEAQLLNEFNR